MPLTRNRSDWVTPYPCTYAAPSEVISNCPIEAIWWIRARDVPSAPGARAGREIDSYDVDGAVQWRLSPNQRARPSVVNRMRLSAGQTNFNTAGSPFPPIGKSF